MSSTFPDIANSTDNDTTASTVQPLTLIDRLPECLRANRSLVIFTAILGAIYWRLSFRPIWHTDIWGHLEYGRLLWNTGALPATEPFMPLAAGMPLVDSAWLSQLVGFGAYSLWGPVALQFVFAASVTLCLSLITAQLHRKTQHVPWCLAGLGAFLWLNWQQLLVGWPEAACLLRPQLAGMICFLLLFGKLSSSREWKGDWILIPALFAIWANFHGSFLMGFVLLGCFGAGRALDIWRRTSRFACVFQDRRLRRICLLAELSAAAVLLNPYGIGLYAEVLNFSSNANLADLIEWEPLGIRSSQGQAAACIGLALAIVYRLSPRRISATEILVLAGLGAWSMWTSRMLIWWAVPAAYYFALHGAAAWKARKAYREPLPLRRSGLYSAVTLGLVWIFFAGSSFGVRVLHGSQLDVKRTVSQATPVAAVDYLVKNPPVGQVFNTYEWGDYLGWAGPPKMQIFVNSHAHLVPTDVWQHYLSIIHVLAGWDDLLERYGVNTVIVEAERNKLLVAQLKEKDLWKVAYEDATAVVLTRRKPILGGYGK